MAFSEIKECQMYSDFMTLMILLIEQIRFLQNSFSLWIQVLQNTFFKCSLKYSSKVIGYYFQILNIFKQKMIFIIKQYSFKIIVFSPKKYCFENWTQLTQPNLSVFFHSLIPQIWKTSFEGTLFKYILSS